MTGGFPPVPEAAPVRDTVWIYHDLIEGLVAAMDARDPYTPLHSKRVSELSHRICRLLGHSLADTQTVHIAGHLHDVGKIGIPDAVLRKDGPLSEDEWTLMKSHAEIGYRILRKIGGFGEVALIVRHHHERWDGRGYPAGLSGPDIPEGSRIIAVADSIDAMLSDRQYRRAMPASRCRAEIERNAGVMYDPRIASAVLENWAVLTALYPPSGG